MRSIKLRIIISAIILIGTSISLGIYIGYEKRPSIEKIDNLLNPNSIYNSKPKIDFNPFWKTWNQLHENYVSL